MVFDISNESIPAFLNEASDLACVKSVRPEALFSICLTACSVIFMVVGVYCFRSRIALAQDSPTPNPLMTIRLQPVFPK